MDKLRNSKKNIFLIYTGNHDLVGSKDYFDQLKLHVDAISNLQKCDYDDINNENHLKSLNINKDQ